MENNKSMLDSILEVVKNNPVLTEEEELEDMMHFPSEDEIKEEEIMTETICNKIEQFQQANGRTPSKKRLKEMIAEERIKRKLL